MFIPAKNLPSLSAKIDEYAKRAKRLKIDPPVIIEGATEIRTEKRKGIDVDTVWVDIEIDGKAPIVPGGWKLLAKVTPLESGENSLNTVPGETAPMEYRKADPDHCDHCGLKRKRNDVFVIENADGDRKIVGRNCLADYLGHVAAETLLRYASIIFDLASDLNWDDPDSYWGFDGGPSGPVGYDTEWFLIVAHAVIARVGWVSKSEAYNSYGEKIATATEISYRLTELEKAGGDGVTALKELGLDDTDYVEKTRDRIKKALGWAKAFDPDDSSNDYLYNLGVAARRGFVDDKNFGIMASLLPAWDRDIAKKKAAAEKSENPSDWVGNVKDRLDLKGLAVTFVKTFDGHYGVSTLVKFRDADGNVFSWFASSSIDTDPYWDAYDDDKIRLDIRGTVKKHDTFRDEKTTALTRVSLEAVNEKEVETVLEAAEKFDGSTLEAA